MNMAGSEGDGPEDVACARRLGTFRTGVSPLRGLRMESQISSANVAIISPRPNQIALMERPNQHEGGIAAAKESSR